MRQLKTLKGQMDALRITPAPRHRLMGKKLYWKFMNAEMRFNYGDARILQFTRVFDVYGQIVLCQNGFHACETIREVSAWYDQSHKNLCLVWLGGKVVKGDEKVVARRIQLCASFPLDRNVVRAFSRAPTYTAFSLFLRGYVHDQLRKRFGDAGISSIGIDSQTSLLIERMIA